MTSSTNLPTGPKNLVGFEEAIENRWTKTTNVLTSCSKHDILFAEIEEPCWACYNEFDREERDE